MRCLGLFSVVPAFSVFPGESEWIINAAEQAQLAKHNTLWVYCGKISNLARIVESTTFSHSVMHLLTRMHCATRKSEGNQSSRSTVILPGTGVMLLEIHCHVAIAKPRK